MGMTADVMTSKAVPAATPETQRFWDGCAAGELWIQRCDRCAEYFFYPRPHCPNCGSTSVRWLRASGAATLESYVISHVPAPGYECPYIVAIVALAEGPRMLTNIVDAPATPDGLLLDMPLRVRFEARGDTAVPVFAPATADDPRR